MNLKPLRKRRQLIINPVHKLTFTDVWCLRTGKVVATYSLPPKEAVLHAYMQLGRSNYNWEAYGHILRKEDGIKVVEAGNSFICVDYWAKKK